MHPPNAEEAAIRGVYTALLAAITAKDVAAAAQLVTADYESIDPHGIASNGRAEFAEGLAMVTQDVSFAVTDFSCRIVRLLDREAEVDIDIGGTMSSLDGTRVRHSRPKPGRRAPGG